MRKVLWFIGIVLLLIPAAGALLFTTPAGPRLIMAAGILPESLSVQEVSGTFFKGLDVRGVRYQEQEDVVEIDALRFSVDWSAILQRSIFLDSLVITGARVRLSGSDGAQGPPPQVNLPLKFGARSLVIRNLSTEFNGADPIGPINLLEAAGLFLVDDRVTVSSFFIRTPDAEASLAGSLGINVPYPVELAVEYRLQPASHPAVAGKGRVKGSLQQLAVQIDNSLPVPVNADLEFNDLLTSFRWQGAVDIPSLPLADIYPDWPEARLENAALKGAGRGTGYQLSFQATAYYREHAFPVRFTAELEGDDRQVRLDGANLVSSFGTLEAKGKLGFEAGLVWEGRLDGAGINPEFIEPQWPGDLELKASFSGTKNGEQIDSAVDIAGFTGTLRGYPVDLKAMLRVLDEKLVVDDFSLRSGNSTLEMGGELGKEQLQLAFTLHSQDLAEILPGLSGTADIQGDTGGTLGAPEINLDVEAAGLVYHNMRLDSGSARVRTGAIPDGAIDWDIVLQNLTVDGEMLLEQADLGLQGTLAQHEISARINGLESDIVIGMSGGIDQRVFQGFVDGVEITSTRFGDWALEQRTTLLLSLTEAEMTPLCFKNSKRATICVEGQRQSAGSWQAGATLADLPVELLEQMAEKEIPLDGLVQGNVHVSGDHTGINTGVFKLEVEGAGLDDSVPDRVRSSLQVAANGLTGRLEDNRLIAGLNLVLDNGSYLTGELRASNIDQVVKAPEQCPVEASLELSFSEIAPLTFHLKDSLALTGSLQGKLSVAGTVEKPDLKGALQLGNAEAVLPRLGIIIKPLNATLEGDNDVLRIEGEGWSGDGWIRGKGTVALSGQASPHLAFTLSGEEFEAVNLTEVKITATPELEITGNRELVGLQGTLHIPRAEITPPDLSGAISPSDDVVLDNGIDKNHTYPVRARVRITTGDDVQVNAYGLKGMLKGELLVVEEPGKPTTGRGELTIEQGSFTLLGRELSLDVGRLLFTGGPLSNPGMEVRSEKSSDGVTTGLEVTGFLKRPVLRLYSDPSMEQQEILMKLVTSKAIGGSHRDDPGAVGSLASMMGMESLATLFTQTKKTLHIDDIRLETEDQFESVSLIIGSWITPRFYVSYGQNLLNETVSFNTRYTLGGGFFLKTETGATSSGGDVQFEIER